MKKYEFLEETLQEIQQQINSDKIKKAERENSYVIPTTITLSSRGGHMYNLFSYRGVSPSYVISLEINIDNLLVYKLDHYLDLKDRVFTNDENDLPYFILPLEELDEIKELLSHKILRDIIGKGLFTSFNEIRSRDII